MRFENKVVFITGGGGYLGCEAAYQFAKEGAAIALCDMNEQALNAKVERIKELGKKENVKVFYGAEIVTVTDDGMHQEFLLIGFDKQFLYDNDLVYKYNQKQLFELANKHNLFMYQTHPFRNGEKTGDPRYMHGAEGFNGHYHHDNNNEKALEFCKANGLKIMVGNDYHHYKQPLIAYMYLPKEIENERQLADYLLTTQPQVYFDQQKCLEERQKFKDGLAKTEE